MKTVFFYTAGIVNYCCLAVWHDHAIVRVITSVTFMLLGHLRAEYWSAKEKP